MGKMWRVSTRRAIAYVEGRENAERVMAAAGREPLPLRRGAGLEAQLAGAMAVYTDIKGKPFAWLIAFDTAQWERVGEVCGTISA